VISFPTALWIHRLISIKCEKARRKLKRMRFSEVTAVATVGVGDKGQSVLEMEFY